MLTLADIWSIAWSYAPRAIGGTIALLAMFWLLRGRIRIDKGWGGFNIPRFSRVERWTHWLLAASFIVLALTGFSFGARRALLELVGAQALILGEVLHLVGGLVFLVCLVLAALFWVRHCLPHWRDAVWLAKGGGVVRGVHPPARKFNAGQKLLVWFTLIGGVVLVVSGAALLLPPLGDALWPWHGGTALALTCVVIVHVYMRTVGIQGAFPAMTRGEVDANWARQHHGLWAEEELKRIEEAEPDAGNTVSSPTS